METPGFFRFQPGFVDVLPVEMLGKCLGKVDFVGVQLVSSSFG